MGNLSRRSIALFAYDFPHRKSYDFILNIIGHGAFFPHVLAAPRKELENVDRTNYFEQASPGGHYPNTKDLCESLGLPFHQIKHENSSEISDRLQCEGVTIGIIAGARIIPKPTIDLFQDGVVNFHPGKLPETSGLDSLFYTIAKDASPGVTTHFIDSRVDAGHQVSFTELQVFRSASLSQINENLYQLQLTELRRFLDQLASNAIIHTPINRPAKNSPMQPARKWEMLARFESWKSRVIERQVESAWFSALRDDNVQALQRLYSERPWLLRIRSEEGWSSLIVASFHQSTQSVGQLLKWGADPNEPNRKGTTPLMYAKTKLLNDPKCDTRVLLMLVEAGADVLRVDIHGKTVLDYVKAAGDDNLYGILCRLVRPS